MKITTLKNIIGLLVLVSGLNLYKAQLTDSENYIYSKTHLSAPGEPIQKVSETVTYFDGLGRPKQSIVINGGGTPATDLVTPVVYDGFGRQVLDVLPIPIATSSQAIHPGITENSGSSFYGARPYSEKILEASPLDRVFQQIQPGNDWQDHPVNFDYQTNTATDVLKFSTQTLISGGAFYTNTLTVSGYYTASTLYRNEVSDEDGNTTYEFRNGEGQTLLVRKIVINNSEVGPSIAPTNTEKVDTYYVYNEYNQLAFVISPLASKEFRANPTQTISNPKTIPNPILDNLCYQYNYDGRNRLVEKKLPGKGWESMVYDKQDRLIMTQDSNLADQGKWLFTKYDQLGRVAFTGLTLSGSTTRSYEQGQADLLPNHFIDGTDLGNNNVRRQDSNFTDYSGIKIYYNLEDTYPAYTNISKLLSINYYDKYLTGNDNYSGGGTPLPARQSLILEQPTLTDDAQGSSISTKGLPVASYVNTIEGDSWTKTYSWYDQKARLIGSTGINHLGGSTIVNSKLDFAGVVQKTQTLHKRLNGETPVNIVEDFFYDHQNRLTKHYHEVVGKTEKVLLAENAYDELGRLKTKKVGAVSDGNLGVVSPELQAISYDYNIRGWMTGINLKQDDANRPIDPTRLFSYKIRYNTAENTTLSRYNGNISEVDWAYQDEDIQRYEYTYDNLNRLRKGDYKSVGQSTTSDSEFYNEELTYDVNGNIRTLKRNAKPQLGTQAAVQVDDLKYYYENNELSNSLLQITDNEGFTPNSNGYPGGGGTITYDSNGNMLTMPDKGITDDITYNYLNLPQQVIQNGNPVTYTYRADGVKVHKLFEINGESIDTDYLDGFVYTTPYTRSLEGVLLDNPEAALAGQPEAFELAARVGDGGGHPQNPQSTPNFFPTAEGFYDYENFRYIYQYKDHLGNVRLSFTNNPEDGSAEAVSSNDYYPFGLNFINIHAKTTHPPVYNPSVSFENWKYNGKELQETGMYDYGARFYMADIGRWGVHDPLSDATFQPYNYASNNPIFFNDPTGMIAEGPDKWASTDVVRNKNGSYTVVGAYDDGDTNIYVVNNATDKKRTGETIGETMRPCDFCTTDDATGGYKFDKNISGVTFNLNNLTVSGTAKDASGRSAELQDMDASELLEWIKQYYMNTINGNMPGTPYGWLQVLKELSANGAILDVKSSMGLLPYTAIGNGKNAKNQPIITTLRAMGNMGFGANMLLAKPLIVGKNFWYGAIMNQAGQYNQSQNGGNGYNKYFPYFGEHSYSGGYIYFGYFRQHYK